MASFCFSDTNRSKGPIGGAGAHNIYASLSRFTILPAFLAQSGENPAPEIPPTKACKALRSRRGEGKGTEKH